MGNLEKAHELNKILLRKLDAVCKKHGIAYYLDSGALLGAVRHKSYIPWDDDVDVALTRENYNKLLRVPKEDWGEDFELAPVEQLVPDRFFDFVTRLVYLGDSIPLQSYAKVEGHVPKRYKDKMVIDLFILDQAYDSDLKQLLLRLRLTMLYGQCMGHRNYIDYSEYSGAQKIVIALLAKIGKLRSLDKLRKKYEKLSQSVKGTTKRYYYSNYDASYLHIVCEKEWYQSAVSLPVDDDCFDAPVGYDKILTMVYGDYMKLPPEDQRVPYHIISENGESEK